MSYMNYFKFLSVAVLILAAVSCKDTFIPAPEPKTDYSAQVLILNSGNWGSNDASLTVLDEKEGKMNTTDIFSSVNGKKLGDVANDMMIYGSKLYIAVTTSAVLFVCDLNGKIITEIKEGSPRCLCANGGKVYATLYEGYVAEIDTASFTVRKVETGPNPEGITYSSGKLYVADSFGYDPTYQYGTTVTVIKASSFTVDKKLTVNNNPHKFVISEDGTLYLITWGNYADIPAALQKINPSTDEVTTVSGVAPTDMAMGRSGIAYILSTAYDAQWNQTFSYYKYDTRTDTFVEDLVSSSAVPNGSFIMYDRFLDRIYIGTSDYVSTGDLYILGNDGSVISKYDTGGMNPITVQFIRREFIVE